MKLRKVKNLTVGAQYHKFNLKENRVFNDEIDYLVEYFFRLLKKSDWKSPHQFIAISLGGNQKEWEGDFYEKEILFDFEEFYKNDLPARKERILNVICEVFLEIAKKHHLEEEIIHSIKKEITASEYKNEWYLKDKLFRSPNHKFYAGIWLEWGEEILSVHFHLFKKDKESLIISDKLFDIPSNEGGNMYYVKPKWLDSSTFLFNNENQEITYTKNIGPIKFVN